MRLNITTDGTVAETREASQVASRTRAVAVASLLALIALGLLWELVLAPTGTGTLALKVLPLGAAVVGLVRYRMYTYRWLSLLLWLYFTEGVVRASSDVGISARLALLEIGLCLVLFAACALHVRQRLRTQAPTAAVPSAQEAAAGS